MPIEVSLDFLPGRLYHSKTIYRQSNNYSRGSKCCFRVFLILMMGTKKTESRRVGRMNYIPFSFRFLERWLRNKYPSVIRPVWGASWRFVRGALQRVLKWSLQSCLILRQAWLRVEGWWSKSPQLEKIIRYSESASYICSSYKSLPRRGIFFFLLVHGVYS